MDYLKIYWLEKYLFEDVGKRFHQGGVIDPKDFYMILIWKANRAKGITKRRLASRANGTFASAVAQISRLLREAPGAKERLEILMVRPWEFRLPTATAILTVLYPEEFTIYDIRVCEVLKGFAKLGEMKFPALWDEYQRFKRAVENTVPEQPHLSLRDKDRYLWGKSFFQQVERECA